MTTLVLVESPAKCQKIASFLGPGYRVMASYGHIRDLPLNAMGISIAGVQVAVEYQLTDRGKEVAQRLRAAAAGCDEVILATDLDREGEAIAWHLSEVLGRLRYRRATFNAITKDAVRAAIAAPRALDLRLVHAQQARRALDRVVGYAVSPTCARGVGSKDARSAGRVQSVAVRLVAERELEIRQFSPVTYYVPIATLAVPGKPPTFTAALVEWKGEPLGQRLQAASMAEQVVAWCTRQPWQVVRSESRNAVILAPPPFITSTLQQAASVRLKLSPEETMQLAQALYEAGDITYMRTDSTAVSPEATAMARELIAREHPGPYLPAQPPKAATSAAHAQEAHEAIRPTALAGGPGRLGEGKGGALYRLIWERFVASQMAAGLDQRAVVDVACAPDAFQHPQRGRIHTGIFRARGTVVVFDGWRRLTQDAAEERPAKPRKGKGKGQGKGKGSTGAAGAGEDESDGAEQGRLPALVGDEPAELKKLGAPERTTRPPPRFTEAGLIKLLERRGVGRPSTYAAVMSNITARGYVRLSRRLLHATDLGIALIGFLCKAYAGNFIEPDFTNRVEADLDRIASGEQAWEPFLIDAMRAVVALARRAGLRQDPLVPVPRAG